MARYAISFNHRDLPWAEWIAWVLREAGHDAVPRPWDYQAGGNFRRMIDEAAAAADQTIVVFSPSYLAGHVRSPEWIRAVQELPSGMRRRLLAVRVADSDPDWWLGPLPTIDLVGLREEDAHRRLRTQLGWGAGLAGPPPASAADRPEFPAGRPALWNVPYARNVFFTGRDEVLRRLRETLEARRTAVLTQDVPGLGGIGKTQTAVEYIYRHGRGYRAVLWARADSETTLDIDLRAIAAVLDLPARQEQDPELVREEVHGWLSGRDDYLLVLDDADDPAVVGRFLPPEPKGHVLLIARAARTPPEGDAAISLPPLPPDEAARFLLNRTGLERSSRDEHDAALALARELGGLPLALEQAAAFIDVHQARFRGYHDLFDAHRAHRAGTQAAEAGTHHPIVAATWAITYDALRRESEAAADLIFVGAFLAPERIPHELLVRGGAELGPALAAALRQEGEGPARLDALLAPLARHGLIRRGTAVAAFDLHRQVQAAVRAELREPAAALGRMRSLVGAVFHQTDREPSRRHVWAGRAVRALARAFPSADDRALGETMLPHALACAQWIDPEHLESAEAALLLDRVGAYLAAHAQEARAEPLLARALAIRERVLGPVHPDTATSFERLGSVHDQLGHPDQAEPLYRQALAARERTLGPEHPDTATSLDRLATLHVHQRLLAQAEPLYRRALAIREKALGSRHVATASSLDNLAMLQRGLGRPGAAEPLLVRALEIWERASGAENPVTIRCVHHLAELYEEQERYDKAETLYRRGLVGREWTLGPNHPDTADSLDRLARLYVNQGRHEPAGPLLARALGIREKEFGPEHPDTAASLDRLATFHHAQGLLRTAEPLFLRALAIRERTLGPDHADTATSLNNLASLYDSQDHPDRAEPLYRRALTIRERVLGPDHIDTAQVLNNLAFLYESRGQYDQAEPLMMRALAILEQTLSADDPTLAIVLENCADLYSKSGQGPKAAELSSRAATVRGDHRARLAPV